MRAPWSLLAIGLLLPLAACSVTVDSDGETTVDLSVTMTACASGDRTTAPPGSCLRAPVPNAEVVIAGTDGSGLWTGVTDSDGTLEASFQPSSDWTLQVTSPFFDGVLESGVQEAGAGTHHSMSLSPPDRYLLTPDPGS